MEIDAQVTEWHWNSASCLGGPRSGHWYTLLHRRYMLDGEGLCDGRGGRGRSSCDSFTPLPLEERSPDQGQRSRTDFVWVIRRRRTSVHEMRGWKPNIATHTPEQHWRAVASRGGTINSRCILGAIAPWRQCPHRAWTRICGCAAFIG